MSVQANGFYDKYAGEIREFDFDASDILFNGDTIQSVAVLSQTSGFTVVSSSFAGATITFRVSGGTAGQIAYAIIEATLVSGQLRFGVVSVLIKPLPSSN